MKRKFASFVKKGIAVGMMAIMAFMLPATPLHESEVQAATVKSTGEFLKDVKLYIKKQGTIDDAKNWCASQEGDWKVFEGDLNAGASAMLTKEVGVFLCYTTTQDPDEAVKDLAVMNEKGGYSLSDYEQILKKQKEQYVDIVKNMRTMLDEYRTNYNNKTEMAVLVHDHLNKFKEDDSGQLLGDLLLTVDDEKLADILLQCNGKVYLDIMQQMAMCCDTAKTTWLDRMVKLGSFDKLKNAFSKNISSGDVTKTLDLQFKEKANKILEKWDEMNNRVKNIRTFIKDNGLEKATEEQFNNWVKNLEITDQQYYSYQEVYILSALVGYKYGGKTLLDFFLKTKAQIEKEGIETLYPMAACLTDGQIAALDSEMSIFALVQDAFAATVVNDNNVGMAAKMKSDSADAKNVEEKVEKAVEQAKEFISEANGSNVVSIYEGVDREAFNGGVAVTTNAQRVAVAKRDAWLKNASNMSMEDNVLLLIAGTIGGGLLAGAFALGAHAMFLHEAKKAFGAAIVQDGLPSDVTNFSELLTAVKDGGLKAKATMKQITYTVYTAQDTGSGFFRLLMYAKWGLTCGFIIMSALSITMSVISIYTYYNVEHIAIPHHMVDLSYSETKEASYVAYKSVRDQDGKCGDLNGNSSLQWLALYYTKDKNAGTPILAPTSEGHEMVLKTGTTEKPGTGYSPLHMFGTVNVAQNLTFASGDHGYSYGDKNNGTYLYYTHANEIVTYTDTNGNELSENELSDTKKSEEGTETDFTSGSAVAETEPVSGSAAGTDQTATTITGGLIALVGAIGLVVGGLTGFVVADTRRKKHLNK